jgi:lipopolysaccharide/colanic/teichoic acid biosynthesis glycosyltransferase
VEHHALVGRVEPDGFPSAKVNETVTSPPPVVEDLVALRRRRRVYRQVVKPTVDRLAAACLLILLSPLIAAVAVGVRMRLGRGVVFRQRRIGLDGAEFTIYKFRTMAPDRRVDLDVDDGFDGSDRRKTHKSDDDPRHTSFGRLMRKYSLDELPQLANVLQGDMSLVGPRPELVDVAVKTGIVDHPRHLVRPGLTGPWQISPARGELIVNGLDLDLEYVATCGPLTDLRLLALTVPAVWRRTGS